MSSCSEQENWREEIRSRQNSEREPSKEPESKSLDVKKGGIIILPATEKQPPVLTPDRPKFPVIDRKNSPGQKTLYDHNNPNKPIVIKTSQNSRISVPGFSGENQESVPLQLYTTDQFGNIRPSWYDENSSAFKDCHYPNLIRDVKRADSELQYIINAGYILISWGNVVSLRRFLMESLEFFLCKDLKFSQTENIEQHFWKILFHNIIEMMRKAISNDPENKEQYKGFVLSLIDEGTKYFEHLMERLEITYSFKVHNFMGNKGNAEKGHRYVGLALVSTQKIFLFLGDLARYREQINETANYGKCRQ